MLAGAQRSSEGRCARIWCRRLRRGSGRRWGGLLRLDWCRVRQFAAPSLRAIRLEVLEELVALVVVVEEEEAGHWVHIVPKARCVHKTEDRFGAEVRLDARAQSGLEGEDDGDAEAAEVIEDSGMPCSNPAEAVEAGKDRLAVGNADRKDANTEVEAEEAAVMFATAYAP
jgi:hypothetical protein